MRLLNGNKPRLSYLRPFVCKQFVLNNEKDDLEKFDPRSDNVPLWEYLSSSKAYRVFNKRKFFIEESDHVVFDKSSNMKNTDMKEDDEMLDIFKSQNHKASRNEVEVNMVFDISDLSPSKELKEDDHPTLGPGPSNDTRQEETHSPAKNDDSEDEEEKMYQPQLLGSRSIWKHSSSYPL